MLSIPNSFAITPVHRGNQTEDSEREKVITAEGEKLKLVYKLMNELVRIMGYKTPVKRRRPDAVTNRTKEPEIVDLELEIKINENERNEMVGNVNQ